MGGSQEKIRIGYVPEHYLTPLHLALRSAVSDLPFQVEIIPFPSGTGHMITSLRSDEIDVAIGLTEGWVAGLVGKDQLAKGAAGGDGGYKMVGQWVETPLRWAIVTGAEREDVNAVGDLKGRRVGVSRLGSGSHIMSFVLAQEQSWASSGPLSPVILGPFPSLRDAVTGRAAEFFMWEHFTTKPYFHASQSMPSPPLKKIGEIYTPWPSWHIAASTSTFPAPETDANLSQLFAALDKGIAAFEADPEQAVRLLGTGELGCTYVEEDAKEWLKDVKFVQGGTRGVDKTIVQGVVDVLKVAGVVGDDLASDQALQRVIGVQR